MTLQELLNDMNTQEKFELLSSYRDNAYQDIVEDFLSQGLITKVDISNSLDRIIIEQDMIELDDHPSLDNWERNK